MGIGAEIAGAGLGMLSDVGSKAIDFGFGQAAASKANQQAKEMYRKRWRWAAADMRKAGFNPILLTKSGPGASPSAALGSTGGPTILGASAARFASAREALERTRKTEHGTEVERQRAWYARALMQEQLREQRFNAATAGVRWQTEQGIRDSWRLRNELMSYEIPSAKAIADFDRTEGGQRAAIARRLLEPVQKIRIPFITSPGTGGGR